jgi:hypothetical protein
MLSQIILYQPMNTVFTPSTFITYSILGRNVLVPNDDSRLASIDGTSAESKVLLL